MKPAINEKDMNVINKIGKIKMIRMFTNLFNSLCHKCKALAMENSRRPLEDYCDSCRPKVKATLDKLQ